MKLALTILFAIISAALGFAPAGLAGLRTKSQLRMGTITSGVDFDTIAREWRMKWSPANDKKSLASVQQTLVLFSKTLKTIPGVKSVQRVVCGGCMDFKVIVALDAAQFGAWEQKNFAPEEDFLRSVKAIDGVTAVETQTYTLENV